MLLQAAVVVAPTCFTENSCCNGHVCLYCASSKCSKKHQHGTGTRFAHQYHKHLTFLCKTHNHPSFLCKKHTRRHALRHCSEAHRIPAGLLQARMHSVRKSVSVVAVKTASNQDTSPQGEASIVYKTAMEGDKVVNVNGNANLNSAHLLNTDMASSEKVDSEALGSKKPSKGFTAQIKDLKNWWTALHEVYREDTAMWGYGSRPIFTVYEGPDSKIDKVLIDEKEIQRREGVEPLLPGFTDNGCKARAEQKIMLAQSIAKDLEMGKIDIDSRSTVFVVVKHPSKVENQTGHQKLLSQIDVAVHKAAPILRSVFMIAIPLYGISLLFGAYLLATGQSEEDVIKKETSAVSLEKMRKLKAQMNIRKGSAVAGQATLAPSDFMQKILEVREMARQVRSEEGLQKLVKDADNDVEEYQPQDQSVPIASISMVGNAVCTEQGGIGHEDVTDTLGSESSVETMDKLGLTESNNRVIDVTDKPRPKVKPRIITSLDEAMAVLGSKQTVLPDGIKSSPKLSGTAETALFENRSQAECESSIGSKVYPDSLTATSNGIKSSPDLSGTVERVLFESRNQVELESSAGSQVYHDTATSNDLNNLHSSTVTMSTKVDKISSTSLAEQDRMAETQTIQSCVSEIPQSDVYLSSEKTDKVTLDGHAFEGRSIEAQIFDPNLEGGTDDLQDSDKTSSLHLPDDNLENGQVNEIRTSSSARHSEMNNPAQKLLKNTSERIPGEVLRSNGFLKKYSASKSVLNVDTDEVVGSGQPLRGRKIHTTSNGPMSNTKRWSKELQRKYDLERDPETRELLKEIGSELESWVTEAEIEEAGRLAAKVEEGDDDVVHKHYEKVQKKIKKEKEKFGIEAVLEKYKEYQPKSEDELWWLDLHCVLCLMVASAKEEGKGLYGLEITIDSEGMSNQGARHVIAFEDRKDASNFCRLLELRSGSRFEFAEVCPFSPKKLYEFSKEDGFKVMVLKVGQIQTNVDQSLEEVEEQIVGIGRSAYWEKMDRDHSIDIDSILYQRFGL